MWKTMKRQALEDIVDAIGSISQDLQVSVCKEDLEADAKALRDLAEAFNLVKRGVMLPDYGRNMEKEGG